MNSIKKLISISVCCVYLTACGGGSEGEASTPSTTTPSTSTPSTTTSTATETSTATTTEVVTTEPEEVIEELVTEEVLADPDASFKVTQHVDYTAYNNSDVNVTLFIYDSLQKVVARHYIKSNDSAEVSVQLPTSTQTVSMSWHYREHVLQDAADVLGISTVNFSGFN